MSERKRLKRQPHGDYEVGYCKPPTEHQFTPGQRPPPRKPKPESAARTFADFIADELRQPMRIVENGVEQVVPKGQALAKAAITGAIADRDPRRLKGFLPQQIADEDTEFSDVDLAIVARFLAQLQKQNEQAQSSDSPGADQPAGESEQ